MAVIIADLKMSIESESYIDAMHAIVAYKGWFSFSKPVLAGMTASAFRFTVNRRLTAESHTAYNWIAENFLAADFIGVAASSAAGFSFDATFPLYKQNAIAQIKEAIADGTGAIIWNDKFVLAVGYDDAQEILFLSNGRTEELELLPYESFGSNASPYWYYQVFESQIPLDHLEICRESLMQAINKWETHDPMLPEKDYACGRAAYDALVMAIKSGDFDHRGLTVVIRSYAAAKRDIRLYFAELKTYWPKLQLAEEQYVLVEAVFREAEQLAGSICRRNGLDFEAGKQLIDILAKAQQAENRAIEIIKAFMRETIDIRRNDIALR